MDRSLSERVLDLLQSRWFFFVLAIALYANTIGNRYALDDGLVLNENSYVMQGMSGIPDILTHDSFHGSIGNSAYLSGGRYRPLSLVTFAIETSLFGPGPAAHHAVNVLLFALNCLLLLRFLQRFIFPSSPWSAWCVALLFTIHPVHTEVVANIKGRDEILSLIFLLLTLHHALAHVHWLAERSVPVSESRTKRKERSRSKEKSLPGRWSGIWSSVFFGLALLSKENGLIFVALLPLTIHFFTDTSIMKALRRSMPVIGLVLFYVALRMIFLDARNNTVHEIMDNPYLLSSAGEKFGTILYVLLLYVKLMLWPHPLTYDYSFHQIPYQQLTSPLALASLVLFAGLLVYACFSFKRKDLLAWCILFYMSTLFLVSNVAFNIGAPMAERFLYQASVPFLIGAVELVRRVFERSHTPRVASWSMAALLTLITGLSSYAVVERNTNWRSGDDLYMHDVKVSTNSARTHTFAGIALIHKSDSTAKRDDKRRFASDAVAQFLVADSIHPEYMPTLLNMGLAHFRLDSIGQAEACWDRARLKDPKDPKLMQLDAFMSDRYFKGGVEAGTKGDYPSAIKQLEKALKYSPDNSDVWYNMGGIYYTAKDLDGARRAWERTLQIKPDHKQAQQGMAALNALPAN